MSDKSGGGRVISGSFVVRKRGDWKPANGRLLLEQISGTDTRVNDARARGHGNGASCFSVCGDSARSRALCLGNWAPPNRKPSTVWPVGAVFR